MQTGRGYLNFTVVTVDNEHLNLDTLVIVLRYVIRDLLKRRSLLATLTVVKSIMVKIEIFVVLPF
jgi:hypothetical protein